VSKRALFGGLLCATLLGSAIGFWGYHAGWWRRENPAAPAVLPKIPSELPSVSQMSAVPSAEAVAILGIITTESRMTFNRALTAWNIDSGEKRNAIWEAIRFAASPAESIETRNRACLAATVLSTQKADGSEVLPADRSATENIFSCIEADDAELNLQAIIALRQIDRHNPDFGIKLAFRRFSGHGRSGGVEGADGNSERTVAARA
jgi:hypothetical protein